MFGLSLYVVCTRTMLFYGCSRIHKKHREETKKSIKIKRKKETEIKGIHRFFLFFIEAFTVMFLCSVYVCLCIHV